MQLDLIWVTVQCVINYSTENMINMRHNVQVLD